MYPPVTRSFNKAKSARRRTFVLAIATIGSAYLWRNDQKRYMTVFNHYFKGDVND